MGQGQGEDSAWLELVKKRVVKKRVVKKTAGRCRGLHYTRLKLYRISSDNLT